MYKSFPIIDFLRQRFQHFNYNKYWRMRNYIQNHKEKNIWCKIRAWFYLLRIKRMDAYNNASFGTHISKCAYFKSPPYLPHGIKGIIISNQAVIGKEVTIYHQVTIGGGKDGGSPVIGDYCLIGPGAKIIGGIRIGNNVKIGANCVVVKDIPENQWL